MEIPSKWAGIIVLMALNMLKGFNFTFRNAETFHVQIEAIKLAFADAHRYVADQRFSQVPVAEMLSIIMVMSGGHASLLPLA